MAPRPIDVTIETKDNTKPGADSAEKNLKAFGTRVKDSILNPLNLVKGGIAALITGTVGMFAKASVESAAAADAAWGRVESAVRNVGMNFDLARGQLDQLFTKIQQTTRYSDDDAADAFAKLVSMSGDYTGSLKALTVVTDLAAAKKMDLGAAADLVGKAMIGETATFKRYGIVIRDGETAMDALRRQFAGFAERDATTLEGKLHQIANAWDNVKEAVGRALTQTDESGKVTNIVVEGLNNLGKWIDDNRAGIQGLVEDLTKLVGLLAKVASWTLPDNTSPAARDGTSKWLRPFSAIIRATGIPTPGTDKADARRAAIELDDFQKKHAENVLARAAKLEQAERDRQARIVNDQKRAAEQAKKDDEAKVKHVAQLKEEYDVILTLARLGRDAGETDKEYQARKEKALGRQIQLERELAAIAKDKTQPLGARSAAADFTADLAEEQRKALAGFDPNAKIPLAYTPFKLPKQPIPVKIGAAPITATVSQPASAGLTDDLAARFGGREGFDALSTSLGDLDDRMASFRDKTLTGFFDAWSEGIDDIIHQHNVLGRVIPQILRKAIASALQADAQDTLLRAAKASWLALTDPSGTHFAQAAGLFAVGSAELAAAAALGGGGGSRSGSGAGVSSGGFQQSQNEIASGRGKVVVHLPRGIEAYTPDELTALADAIHELDSTREIEFTHG